MSTQSQLSKFAFIAAGMAMFVAPSGVLANVYELDISFGAMPPDPPTGTGGWLTATVADNGSGGIFLTLQSNLSGSTEFIDGGDGWLFNLDPALDPTQLSISYIAGPYPNLAVVSTGVNAFQADGDGFFDIAFNFPQAPPGDRFNNGDSATYLLTYPSVNLMDGANGPSGCPLALGVDLQCISFPSAPGGGQGTYITAAHVQGTGGGQESDWIGNQGKVPEPTTVALLLSGGLMLAAGRSRRIR